MSYQIIEKIGRAGGFKNREAVQKEWDNLYGEGNWTVGYVYNNQAYTREEALNTFYNQSYLEFIKNNFKKINSDLIQIASELFNPHAVFTTGVDLQVPAVMNALNQLNVELQGHKKIAIGSFQVKFWNPRNLNIAKKYNMEISDNRIIYPEITNFLSPFRVPLMCDKNVSIEDFWQNYKYLLSTLKDKV